MRVIRVINSPVDSTCYVVASEVDNVCVVIDPGTEDCKGLFACLEDNHLNVEYIFLTHEHIDHIIGCKVLKERDPDAKLVCSDLCSENLNDTRYNLSRLAENFTPRNNFPNPDIVYDNWWTTMWQGENMMFRKLEGHSKGSSIAQIGKNLFVGDTFIYQYKTTTTLPGASKVDMVKAFEHLLNNYSDKDIVVYPGHFASCSLQDMKAEIKPQLEMMKMIVLKKSL